MTAAQKVGKYLLLQEEDKNIVRTSYRAGEIQGNRLVNHYRLELFNPKLAENTQFVEQLASQSAISAKVQHPNIAQKITMIHEEGQLAALFEYVEGTSLQQVMNRSKAEGFPFSIDHALLVASKLVTGLAAAKAKGIQHGLVNPSFIFITNEGEVKISGFSVSAPLRAALGAHPDIAESFKDYLPEGPLAGDGGPDRFDIFASGVILFEMLTGEPFYAKGRDVNVRQRIDEAVAAADMEKIPPSITKILESAIDPQSASAYHDIQQMVSEMDNLIFSGEYSPTTFNLAFFMHSAFRQEIEAANAAIKEERERTYETTSAGTPLPQETPAPAAAPAAQPEKPVVSDVAPTPPAKKSNLPIIISAVAAVVIIVAVAVYFLVIKPGAISSEDKFQKQQQALMKEREAEARRLERERSEMLRAEIDALKEQIEQRNQEEAERLQDEIEGMDEKIKLVQEKKKREQEMLEMKLRLEQLEKEKQAEKRMREEQERIAREAEEERLRKEAEKKRLAEAQQEQPDEQAETGEGASETTSEVAVTRAPETETEQPTEDTSAEKPAEAETQTAEAETTPTETETLPAVPAPVSKVPETPPEEGELVEMDETVIPPALEETLRFLEVPPKAVRSGAIRSGQIKTFLVKALVNERGRVDDVKIVRNPLDGQPDDFGMESKALKTARKLKFKPGEKMGVKVKVWTTVGIHFKAF